MHSERRLWTARDDTRKASDVVCAARTLILTARMEIGPPRTGIGVGRARASIMGTHLPLAKIDALCYILMYW
jgi:hypothetical protein